MASNRKRILQIESDDDADQSTHFIFKSNETFPRFLVIQSEEAKEITSLSPFVIEKQIESFIGTPKSVKKLKNKTLLVETNRKSQSDNLLKIQTFFGLKVSVTEHKSLNTSSRDRMLKSEKEDDIVEYLKEQGVVACKRFTIKKDHETVQTNTLLLTFNSVSEPKSLSGKFSIGSYQLTCMCQILLDVLTVRGLAIMRQIAQLISDLFGKNAVREVTTTIPPPAKTLQSVLTAVKTTFHDPISVKYGKKKKKLVKLK